MLFLVARTMRPSVANLKRGDKLMVVSEIARSR
jgi:hypothetical protein